MSNTFAEIIDEAIENAMGFRNQKAEEYPDDERNQKSIDALYALQQNLIAIPQDPLWQDGEVLYRECNRLFTKTPDAEIYVLLADDGVFDKACAQLWEQQVQYELERAGFDGLETDGRKFLAEQVRALYRNIVDTILPAMERWGYLQRTESDYVRAKLRGRFEKFDSDCSRGYPRTIHDKLGGLK